MRRRPAAPSRRNGACHRGPALGRGGPRGRPVQHDAGPSARVGVARGLKSPWKRPARNRRSIICVDFSGFSSAAPLTGIGQVRHRVLHAWEREGRGRDRTNPTHRRPRASPLAKTGPGSGHQKWARGRGGTRGGWGRRRPRASARPARGPRARKRPGGRHRRTCGLHPSISPDRQGTGDPRGIGIPRSRPRWRRH